jgi:peptide/nickel transport system permease protein
VVAAAACAVFAAQLAPYDPTTGDLGVRLRPPGWLAGGSRAHVLGTDQMGRDILSRVVYGARVSLLVGLVSSLIGGTVGLVLGVVGGYFRGRADTIIAKLIDVQLAFPFILVAITVIAVLGPSLRNLLVLLAVSGWVTYARVVRGQTLSLRERDFVDAARGLGAPSWRIIARHIVPNVLPFAVVVMTTEIGRLIVLESTLSFLGLGVPPPTPSWGMALADGKDYLISGWWLATFPGLAIMIVVLCMNVLGDGVRDLLEPTLRGRRRVTPEGVES